MKIVYVCDAPFSGIGGSIKSAKTIINAMVAKGYDVTLLLIGKDEHIQIPGCRVDYYNQYFFYQKSNLIAKIWRCIIRCIIYIYYFNTHEVDVVHVHSSSSAKFIAGLKKYGLIPKKTKYIFNDRHYYSGYEPRNQHFYARTINSWDIVLCTTENNKQSWLAGIRQRGIKISENKIRVVSNALEPFWFDFSNSKRTKIRDELGIKDSDYVVGFSGRYESWKRWDVAVEIAKHMMDMDNVHFMVAIGKGSDEGKMKSIVQQFESLLGNRVHIYIDVGFEQMEKFYYALDFFVLTSENESFGRTLIEAMTKKVVVLASNSGGAPNVIQKDENLFEVGDSGAAVRIIQNYIIDESRFEKDKNYFFALANREYQEKNMVDSIEKIYIELLK